MASGVVAASIFSQGFILKWLAIIAIAAAPFIWAGKAFTPPDQDRLARKEAGEWILSHVGQGKDIVSNRERIVYYADGVQITIEADPKQIKTWEYMGHKIVGYDYNILLRDVIDKGSIQIIMAIDYSSDDYSKSWISMLDSLGIKPDKTFRSIYVYLPGKYVHKGTK
jgi:hypothetical protein